MDELGLSKGGIWLFELGTVTPIRGMNIPDLDYLKSLLLRNRLSFWNSWSALALRDTVTFLEWGTAGKGDNIDTFMSKNAIGDYFYLYLYCLYQKIALLKLQNYLIDTETDTQIPSKQLQELMGQLVEFRNRFWFAEVTRKVLGNTLYKKFQEAFETQVLYEFVSTEINDLYSFFCAVADRERSEREKHQIEETEKRERRLNRRINFIAAVLGLPSLIIGFLGINLRGITSSDSEGLSILFALLLFSGSLMLGTFIGILITRHRGIK